MEIAAKLYDKNQMFSGKPSPHRPLRILFFHLGFFYSGGGEKLVIQQVSGLRERGHHVECWVPLVNSQVSFPDLLPALQPRSILPPLPKFLPSRESLAVLAACLVFPLIAWRYRHFDIVVGANQPGPWFGFWVRWWTGTPYLAYLAQPTRLLHPRPIDRQTGLHIRHELVLTPRVINWLRPFFNFIDQLSIRRADKILVNGGYAQRIIEKVYQAQTVNCPAGAEIPSHFILPAQRTKGKFKINGKTITKPFLLVTNRHFPQKRFEYAILAFSGLIDQFPRLKLVITGEPTPYTRYLQILCSQLALSQKVIFTGLVSESDLQKLYSLAQVYLYTSPEEDFGMGIIEAMAAATPVVAWKFAGPTVTVQDQVTGFLVPPYKISSFSFQIKQLLLDQALAQTIGRAARKRVQNYFSVSRHLNQLEHQIYHCQLKAG